MNSVRNTLIDLLPPDEGRQLESLCRPVVLQAGELLQDRDVPTRHVYFPTGALVCLFATMRHEPEVEVAMVGHEGMVGIEVALGSDAAPLLAVVQEAGTALRVDAEDFTACLAQSAAMQDAMDRYVHTILCQLVTTAACVHAHQVAPRLARWLLMTQDRAGSSSFHVTQQFLAAMLGVRRVGITTAAKDMQRSGLIDYSRGTVTVLDRQGLRAASCNCYKTDRMLYTTLLKEPSPKAANWGPPRRSKVSS